MTIVEGGMRIEVVYCLFVYWKIEVSKEIVWSPINWKENQQGVQLIYKVPNVPRWSIDECVALH